MYEQRVYACTWIRVDVCDVSDGDKIKAPACVLSKAGAHGKTWV